MKGFLKGLAVVVGVLAIALFATRDYIKLHLAGWLAPATEGNRAVTWARGPETAPPGRRPPNVILIVADDLGYNDITGDGGTGVAGGAVPTPNIDAIGQQGARFTNGYAGNATCAPSRAALMSGRYATRFGYEFTPADAPLPKWLPSKLIRTDSMFARNIASFPSESEHKVFFDEAAAKRPASDAPKGMPASEVTIAELLKGRGYHTVHLGKWHLGDAAGMRPENQGFDESLGFMIGGQKYLPDDDAAVENSKQDFDPIDRFLWANLPFSVQYNGGPRFAPDRYMTDYLTAQAVASIAANRNRPFFMYLAYNAPHTPLQAAKADYDALPQIKDHRLRVYGAMIRALDRGVGQVMAELKRQGLDDNTIVVFTSDNGGAHYIGLPAINRPFRGWKATFYEGGTHVPFFIRWPAAIAPGTTVAAPVSHFDIFATAGAAAGAALPADRVVDGIDLLPLTRGAAAPQRALFWRSGGYKAVREGDWKLQQTQRPVRALLFNLKDDPAEHRDLAAAEPARVAAMTAMLVRHDAEQQPPAWPALIQSPIPIDQPLGSKPVPGSAFIYWSN